MNSAHPTAYESSAHCQNDLGSASADAMPARESNESGMETVYLHVSDISTNGRTQARVEINPATVAEYANALCEGGILPPPVVFFDGSTYHLADGFHRYHAYSKIGAASMECEVRTGTLLDARMFAYGANKGHGLPRTSADKRKAVLGALADAPDWSDRAIATHVGVSPSTVGACRSSLSNLDSDPAERNYTTKRGTTATTDIPGQKKAGQGKKAKPTPELAAADPGRSANKADERSAVEPEAPAAVDPRDAKIKALTAERDTLVFELNESLAENTRIGEVLDADDKVAAAMTGNAPLAAENKRLRAEVAGLRERVNGLMEEKNAAIRRVKSLMAKLKKAGLE